MKTLRKAICPECDYKLPKKLKIRLLNAKEVKCPECSAIFIAERKWPYYLENIGGGISLIAILMMVIQNNKDRSMLPAFIIVFGLTIGIVGLINKLKTYPKVLSKKSD